MRRSLEAGLILLVLVLGLAGCGTRESEQDRNARTGLTDTEPAQELVPEDHPSGHKAGDRVVKVVDGVEYAFRWCPPGSFEVGSPESEWTDIRNEMREIAEQEPEIKFADYDETQHQVTLTEGFWMMETEVTVAMFKSFVKDTGYPLKGGIPSVLIGRKWKMNSKYSWEKPGYRQRDDYPVVCVSWYDTQAFCEWLSDKTGLQFNLPTEAQWEYACRAGTTGPYAGDLDAMAWYKKNSGKKVHPVAQKQANAWGLYDMHGNVAEWCDDFSEAYPREPVTDPKSTERTALHRVRGGWWFANANRCRSTFRGKSIQYERINLLGFRLVCSGKPAELLMKDGSNEIAEPQMPESDANAHKAGDRMVKTVNGVEYAFRWCPAGTFIMGMPGYETGHYTYEKRHRVTLTEGFWMLETEVTVGMFKSFVKDSKYTSLGSVPRGWTGDDWLHDDKFSWKAPGFSQDDSYPVVCVSWYDAEAFCEWLSEKTCLQISLPTEAQWEYACRAGTTGLYAGDLDAMAWYEKNSGKKTHPVAQKKANAWGLYDMHGNVWEWCQDLIGDNDMSSAPVTDPQGPECGNRCVARGGDRNSKAYYCRSAFQGGSDLEARECFNGFRFITTGKPVEPSTVANPNENTATEAPAADVGSRKAGDRLVKTLNGVEFAFRWCPAGTFTMGDSESKKENRDENPPRRVTLTKGFWMLETEVTERMWQCVMKSSPDLFVNDKNFAKDKNCPVTHISWNACQDFCTRLSRRIGMKLSLPTAAQWEYACRAGTTGPYAGNLDAMAWYEKNSGMDDEDVWIVSTMDFLDQKTHPVAQKQANAWGLYDMHGNVWEWCLDWCGKNSSSAPVTDPTGPNDGYSCVCRGGSWKCEAEDCRSTSEDGQDPDCKNNELGFRIIGLSE